MRDDAPGEVEEDEPENDTVATYREWWSTIQGGLAEARTSAVIRHLIIVGALMEGLFVFDEYVPIVADNLGASDGVIPIIVLIVWVGLLVGGEVAARRPEASGRALGLGVVVGSLTMGGALMADWYWALALVGVGYAALQATWVLADARLQAQVAHRRRATVSSVRSFGAGIVGFVAFALIALLTRGDDPRPGLYLGAGVLVATGLLTSKWMPSPATSAPVIHADDASVER